MHQKNKKLNSSQCSLLAYNSPPSAHPSEGVIAYYWSQFNVPVDDLEIVPEISEERVLEVLEKGIEAQSSVVRAQQIRINEITASCRYHRARPLCVRAYSTV